MAFALEELTMNASDVRPDATAHCPAVAVWHNLCLVNTLEAVIDIREGICSQNSQLREPQSANIRHGSSSSAENNVVAAGPSSPLDEIAQLVPLVAATPYTEESNTRSPEFCGPSSAEFTLNVASGNLRAMGISAAILDKNGPRPGMVMGLPSRLAQCGSFTKLITMDPLWDLGKEDALILIDSWFDGVGSLYPVVSRQKMVDTANSVFSSLERVHNESIKSIVWQVAETLFSEETNKMRIVLAISRTLESGGRNEQAQKLFESVTEAVESLIWNSDGINGIQLLTLVAIYHYHLDDEVRTGRIIGFAARLCLEMGLHRRQMVEKTFASHEEQLAAVRVFWSVYMFERRTSLGQGVPFYIQDSHIDPSLFAIDASNTLLSVTIEWTKLAGKVWVALNSQGEKGAEIDREDMAYLDYQVTRWYDKVPDQLKLDKGRMYEMTDLSGSLYYQAVLDLRKSHLRNLIHRPVLYSPSRIYQNEQCAIIALELAKDSIRTLSILNENTTVIRTNALFFKHLLLTAFGNLLLAVVNASSLFAESVRGEFNLALNLIKLLSSRSAPMMRLWQRLQGLQNLETKILHRSTGQDIGNRDTAVDGTAAEALSFDSFLNAFPTTSATARAVHTPADSTASPRLREQVNNLFDGSVGLDMFFDFPFFEWEQEP